MKCYIVGKISFLGMFLTVNIFTSRLMIISWSSVFFLRSFAYHFQIKLITHGSNLNFVFIIITDLQFFLLIWVLVPNFTTLNLVKF
jgi:hypothetical protein